MERPIIFSGPMIRAILEGRKTQTRRVIKPQPVSGGDLRCMPFQVGQILWMRETWAAIWTEYEPDWEAGQTIRDVPHRIEYRADSGAKYPGGWSDDNTGDDPECAKWRASIHMPRWASRLILRITDVRVQRVREISEEDAEEEGLRREACDCPTDPPGYGHHGLCPSQLVWQFAQIWDVINAKRGHSWDMNSWVWVISFEKIEEVKR